MKKTLPIYFLILVLTGCNSNTKKENDLLRQENELLKKEVNELKFGADKLLSEAKALFEREDYYSVESKLEIIVNKYPGTSQSIEAKNLLLIVEKKIQEKKAQDEKDKIQKENEEKEKLANATKKLRTSYDDIKGITWYYDKGTPKSASVNSLYVYMGKASSGTPWLRFTIQYASSDWLFIEKYIIKTDNNSYTITTSRNEVERDNGYGGIWEWYDVKLDQNLYNIIKDIISSKNVKIRYNGKQYYKDRTVTEKEKKGLQNILDAYKALGGTFNF